MNANLANSDVYFDFQGLNDLKRLSRADRSEEALRKVAREFESMFVRMMLKSMRDTSFGDPYFDSAASGHFREMYDQQLAVDLARGQGLGLADMMVRQLRGYIGNTLPQDGKAADPEALFFDPSRMAQPTQPAPQPAADPPPAAVPNPRPRDLVRMETMGPPFEQLAWAVPAGPAPTPSVPSRDESDDAAQVGDSTEAALSTPEDFVHTLWPLAQEAGGRLGVDPEVLLAQAALETGWGRWVIRHGDGRSSHNLFNIKADSRWDGERAVKNTLEYRGGVAVQEQAAFRSYGSYAESFRDYVAFIGSSPRYREALEHGRDAGRYVEELQRAGYATDPDYAAKIRRILGGEPLAEAMTRLKVSHSGTLTNTGG